MKKAFKKIAITGKNGLLGSYFYKKYKNEFKIISYSGRVENSIQFKKWSQKNNFDIFIHFAAITNAKNEKKRKKLMDLVNRRASINMIKILNKSKKNYLKYFLFISTSHVYGYSKNAIKENKARKPINYYGKTKKKVEDYIFENRKKFNFKISVARIFNFTHQLQKKGHFVPDVINKIKKGEKIKNINCYRDFIHIDDVCTAIYKILQKNFTGPINICSGKKINLMDIAKHISKKVNKEAFIDKRRALDLFGDNSKLKLLGLDKFKLVKEIQK